jgi:hypothetical protein
MDKNTLERCVAALEAEMQRLKGRASIATAPWWEQIAGVFAGDRRIRSGDAPW